MKNKLDNLVNHVWIQHFYTWIEFLLNVFEFENVKRKKCHMLTWTCKQLSFFSITWIMWLTHFHMRWSFSLRTASASQIHKYSAAICWSAGSDACAHFTRVFWDFGICISISLSLWLCLCWWWNKLTHLII